jgi:NADH-quinone oxidoreductase subunit N
MAFGAKAGGFAALLRVFITAFPSLSADITPVMWGLAALTMILGNILALAQGNIKRMLAYSSISHAGYILMALVPFGQQQIAPDAVASVLFYLLAYAITNFAAWSVVIAVEKAEVLGLMIQDYAGLGSKYPGLAAVMAIAMFSFTGVPPTVGFLGKFYLFRVALEGGYIWLAIIGVMTSLISAYYYLRVVIVMYTQEGNPVARSETWLNITAAVSGICTLLLIVISEPLLAWITQAVLK